MRRFVRVELGDYVVPDEATFCSTLETPTVDIFAMELLVAAKLECWHVAGFNQAINGAPMYLQIHRGGRLPSKWGQHTRAELATMASLLPRFFSTLGSLTLDHFSSDPNFVERPRWTVFSSGLLAHIDRIWRKSRTSKVARSSGCSVAIQPGALISKANPVGSSTVTVA